MKEVLGVINLYHEKDQLEKLTMNRPLASVPFGGRYRIIDFTLSNMVNSNIKNVAILMNQKYRSLMDHLGNGEDWDLNRKDGGLFLLPASTPTENKMGLTDLRNLYQHLEFFQKAKQEQLLFIDGAKITNMDYRPVFRSHMKNDADITMLYPDMFFIKKSIFMKLIKEHVENKEVNTLTELIEIVTDQYHVMTYYYQNEVIQVSSINEYYQVSIKLLELDYFNQLVSKPAEIYSKEKDDAPVRYTSSSEVINSLIANGSVIEGKVEGSIISRGVKVHKGASIKNSIIFQRCEIGENVVLENVILDKEVIISPNQKLISEADQPIVIEKGALV